MTEKPPPETATELALRGRFQIYNPRNDRWAKRDAATGKFLDQKGVPDPFRGFRRDAPPRKTSASPRPPAHGTAKPAR